MSFIPPYADPFPTLSDIVTQGMIPQPPAAHPNEFTAIFTNPPGDSSNLGSYRSMHLTTLQFFNTSPTDVYTCAWSASWNYIQVWSNGAAVGDQGPGDPAIQLGRIDLDPYEIAIFDTPIVLVPGMSLFAWQGKKGTVGGQAITLHVYGQWEPITT